MKWWWQHLISMTTSKLFLSVCLFTVRPQSSFDFVGELSLFSASQHHDLVYMLLLKM
jgi:hypothetical protein